MDELPADLRLGAFFCGDADLLLGDQPLESPPHQHVCFPISVPAVAVQHVLLFEIIDDPLLRSGQLPQGQAHELLRGLLRHHLQPLPNVVGVLVDRGRLVS